MAGEAIYACTGATHTAAIPGVTAAKIIPRTVVAVDKASRSHVITHISVGVELYGNDIRAMFLKVGAAVAPLVLAAIGRNNAAENHTLLAVRFTGVIGTAELASRFKGGKIPTVGIRGNCELASTETFATAWTVAAGQ